MRSAVAQALPAHGDDMAMPSARTTIYEVAVGPQALPTHGDTVAVPSMRTRICEAVVESRWPLLGVALV